VRPSKHPFPSSGPHATAGYLADLQGRTPVELCTHRLTDQCCSCTRNNITNIGPATALLHVHRPHALQTSHEPTMAHATLCFSSTFRMTSCATSSPLNGAAQPSSPPPQAETAATCATFSFATVTVRTFHTGDAGVLNSKLLAFVAPPAAGAVRVVGEADRVARDAGALLRSLRTLLRSAAARGRTSAGISSGVARLTALTGLQRLNLTTSSLTAATRQIARLPPWHALICRATSGDARARLR
jgi:hypothetical protein